MLQTTEYYKTIKKEWNPGIYIKDEPEDIMLREATMNWETELHDLCGIKKKKSPQRNSLPGCGSGLAEDRKPEMLERYLAAVR